MVTFRTPLAFLLSALLPAAALAEAEAARSYRLHHRLYHIAFERPLFQTRGELHLAGPNGPQLEAYPDAAAELESFAAAMRTGIEEGWNTDEVLYQVALEREGDQNEKMWDVAAVKAVRKFLQ